MCIGALLYAEKPTQPLSKDAYSSANAAPGPVKLPAWGTSNTRENHTERWQLPWPGPPEIISRSADKKKRTKALENSTGLRKQLLQYGGGLPLASPTERPSPVPSDFNQANRKQADRQLAEAANSVSAHFDRAASSYQKVTSLVETLPFPDSGAAELNDPNLLDHFNRPGKTIYKHTDPLKGIRKPSWVTNRQPSTLSYHFSALKKGKGMDRA